MAYYRIAVREDCAILAPKMRKQDAQEVWHSDGMSPLEALEMSYDAAEECNTIIDDDGEVIGIFGVSPAGGKRIGSPFLLASDKLPTVAKEFIPQSKEWIEKIHENYDLLFNYVHADNKISMRWLRWLGFNFIQKLEYGVNPSHFYEFVKLKVK